MVVDTSLTALRVMRELDQLIESRSCPRMIVSDNGTEFIGVETIMRLGHIVRSATRRRYRCRMAHRRNCRHGA
jgi:hypothetical protein